MRTLIESICLLVVLIFPVAGMAADLDGTLKKIKETKTITLGYRESSIPLSYLDGKQQPVGYSMDVCMEIVDAVKDELNIPDLQVKLNPITSQTRIPLMMNGTVDLDCGSTTNTKTRQKQVSFLYTHFVTGIKLLVKKKEEISSYRDLKGKTVVAVNGTTSERLFRELNNKENLDIKLLLASDMAEAFLMVETERGEAWPIDESVLYPLIALSKNPEEFEVVGEFMSYEPISIMIRKDDPQFKRLGDETLKKLFDSGKIYKMYEKWFLSPIPPKGITLGLPIGKKMQELIMNPNDEGV